LPSIDIVDNPPLFDLVTQTSLLYPYVETALQLVALSVIILFLFNLLRDRQQGQPLPPRSITGNLYQAPSNYPERV
jgi:hypothetical protein